MKHSSTPWHIKRLNGRITAINSMQHAICVFNVHNNKHNGEANAKLIEQAPIMLQMLIDIERMGCGDYDRTQLRKYLKENFPYIQ